jgi:hypothetical protein
VLNFAWISFKFYNLAHFAWQPLGRQSTTKLCSKRNRLRRRAPVWYPCFFRCTRVCSLDVKVPLSERVAVPSPSCHDGCVLENVLAGRTRRVCETENDPKVCTAPWIADCFEKERTFAIIQAPSEKGDYVLRWRWDVEQNPQVWTHCADVTVM